MKRLRRAVIIAFVSFAGLCLVLVAASALSNIGMPQVSPVVETLSEGDKLRLAEALHLRETVGDEVWPGWGRADIPAILYNESYAFLVGLEDPADGWLKVPSNQSRGGPWETVAGDSFNGRAYYRQALTSDITPEAFTVLVGDRWTSSLQTLDSARISLAQPIRHDLPAFLRPIFPYRLFIGQLLGGSDRYITLLSHEAFHAYQGATATDKFALAEIANQRTADSYPWDTATLESAWQVELDLLAQALEATERTDIQHLASEFLDVRSARRESNGLTPELIAFERQREWLEGLARYAELEIWREATSEAYVPLAESGTLGDLRGYTGFDARWSQELQQMVRMAGDRGDGRFYYSGMAQAYLLDRLAADWKERAFDEGVWLEDLLYNAVQGGR